MRIRLVGHAGEPVMKVGDAGPWWEFVKELENKGCEIVTSGYGAKVDALVANAHSKNAIKECKRNNVSANKMFLILWEPKVVDHKRHSKKALSNYGTVWTPSIKWASESKNKYFNWPQLKMHEHNETIDIWQQRENKACMVLANKFSSTKNELYSLRREVSLLTSEKGTMDLYGNNWNKGKIFDYSNYALTLARTPINLIDIKSANKLGRFYKNYKGPCINKTLTSRKYRIVTVIENSNDYISEKFFDAFDSGAIVIYVGTNIDDYGIFKNTAIEAKSNADTINKKIIEVQSLSLEEQFAIMKEQQQKIHLISDNWYGNYVLKKLASDIYGSLLEQF